jgi:hypothetical protein
LLYGCWQFTTGPMDPADLQVGVVETDPGAATRTTQEEATGVADASQTFDTRPSYLRFAFTVLARPAPSNSGEVPLSATELGVSESSDGRYRSISTG